MRGSAPGSQPRRDQGEELHRERGALLYCQNGSQSTSGFGRSKRPGLAGPARSTERDVTVHGLWFYVSRLSEPGSRDDYESPAQKRHVHVASDIEVHESATRLVSRRRGGLEWRTAARLRRRLSQPTNTHLPPATLHLALAHSGRDQGLSSDLASAFLRH